jgi:hypothetical protein
MPASYALLCAFIGNYKGSTSGKTIKSWLSGIRAWHLTNHAPWYGDDNWVKMARISANKEGSRHKRALRAPVSIEHLLALRRVLDLSIPFHAAIWAVALVTFFACRRLGETTIGSISSFDPKLHVLHSAEYVHLHHLLILLIFFIGFLLPLCETVHVRHHFTYLGQRPPTKKEPPSSLLLATTSFAPAPHCGIILMSTGTFRVPPHFLHTLLPTDNGRT